MDSSKPTPLPLPEFADPREAAEPFDAYILAAGRSLRMGSPKALLPAQGEDLLCAIARRYREAGARTIWGLVSEETGAILQANSSGLDPGRDPSASFGDRGLVLLTDVDPRQPMMDSVRRAFMHCSEHSVKRFFLQPVDAGIPTREVLELLWRNIGHALVAKPCHQGRGGHPLLFSYRALELMNWKVAASLRDALHALPETSIRRVDCAEASVLRNWNRPEDLDDRLS